jgi:hypothetical protein
MKDHLRSAFRDDAQVAEVCKLLCEHASMPGMGQLKAKSPDRE